MSLGRSLSGALLLVLLGAFASPVVAQSETEWSGYGYVKLDASWDDSLLSAGNFARWAFSPEDFEKQAHFNMTARQSRLGVRIERSRGSARLQGRLEFDFYGAGAENRNTVQVRHAFVQVDWPSGWSLLAGQSSDVISPLAPSTLNYTVAWWAGNIGYRKPQLTVTNRSRLGPLYLTATAAATRTIGDAFGVADPGDTGADSGHPTVAGRLAARALLPGGEVEVGFSAHRGDENLREQLGGDAASLATSSWSVDGRLHIRRIEIEGETWAGSNLDDQLGGVGQGLRFDETSATGIYSRGGWVQAAWRGEGRSFVGLGIGADDPADEDLSEGFRSHNSTAWITVMRDLGEGLAVGLEVSDWRTQYIGKRQGSSLRVQTSVLYAF